LTGVLEEALVALFKGVRDVCVGAGASTIVPVEKDVIGAARLDEDGDPTLWDGIDGQLGITEKELASWFEPLRLAIGFTRKDHHVARQAMHNILDDPDGLGSKLGRKPKLNEHQRKKAAKRLRHGESARAVARTFNVHHATISRLRGSA
jgi:hypothetical protein